jgi:branched-subunit amino acid aminotransferase/4-amino-4-deoxychorismate lyase
VQSADHHNVLRWSAGGLRPSGDDPAAALLAVDSWLVDDGAVRGYDLHWERFGGWCRELGFPDLARFRAAVTAALPRSERWFPRVEAVEANGSLELQLRLRPAAPLVRDAAVIVGAPGDARVRPRWKGPDLKLLLALRARAVAAGAGELLVCDGEGRLVEGAFTSLLWWEDGALWTTPGERTLPGVTRALLLAIAQARGVRRGVRSPLAAELLGCEAWLVNAAHGICVVTAWDGIAAAAAPRAARWQAALEEAARPLDEL